MREPDPLTPLRDHPVFSVAEHLAPFLGVQRDVIMLSQVLSLAAGLMKIPFNIDVVTDVLSVDLQLTDRLLSLTPDAVARIDTYQQFRNEEANGFRDRAVLLVRRGPPRLYQYVNMATARSIDSVSRFPCVWHFSDRNDIPFLTTPTLRLVTKQAHRDLRGFAANHASTSGCGHERQYLQDLLAALATRPNYPCGFRDDFVNAVEPVAMLVCERLLLVFANLRRVICESTPSEQAITLADYRAVRSLLVHLPLAPIGRTLSAHAITTAETVYRQLDSGNHQLSLPDRSQEGHKWFTRSDAVQWTDYGYTTVKKHLDELEGAAILLSTVAENNRDHGRKIHFRFAARSTPPFGWANPYEALPDMT